MPQGTQRALAHQRPGAGRGFDGIIHRAAHQRGHGGVAALEGDMQRVQLGTGIEHRRHQMLRAAHARGGEAVFPWIGAQQIDEFARIGGGELAAHDEDIG